jgi:DNA mismatch repair protein MutL
MDLANVIKLLPDSIANQIAAGEVVQRPASAVKELLENSIDAGSSEIKLIVKNAGKSLIQVIDNGSGMNEIDARMCFERHATSKLRNSEDLFRITTMGFRGEALASIAAVSQTELISSTDNNGMGTCINIEGSIIKDQTYVSALKGTKISVKNLFFNIPARRTFLKSNVIELKHIIEEFQKAALSRPDITFSFYNEDLNVYHLPAGKLSHRIVNIFGKNYKEQLIHCMDEGESIQLKGYIGKPENVKKTRGEQFFFVNNRFIKSPFLHHAVKNAFQNLIPQDTFPFYVIFINLDPQSIDVNIHPTKNEIKFQEEKLIYAVLQAAVKRALAEHHIIPSLDFERNVNSDIFEITNTNFFPQNGYNNRNIYAGTQPPDTSRYENFLDTRRDNDNYFNTEFFKEKQQVEILKDSYVNAKEVENLSGVKTQIGGKYILLSLKESLVIINQSAAHERVIYEKILKCLVNKEHIDSQQLLFPYKIELSPADLIILKQYKTNVQALGFSLEFNADNEVLIKGYPNYISENLCTEIIEIIIEKINFNQNIDLEEYQNDLAQFIAKKACIKSDKFLNKIEIDSIVDNLFLCDNPNYTSDGTRIFTTLYIKDIDELIK